MIGVSVGTAGVGCGDGPEPLPFGTGLQAACPDGGRAMGRGAAARSAAALIPMSSIRQTRSMWWDRGLRSLAAAFSAAQRESREVLMPNLGVAIVRQYERGVVFRLGQVRNVREPGLRFMIPLVDRMRKVSLRTVTMPIPSQQIITRDNVSIGVAAVAYYRRVDPVKSIVEIENVEAAVGQIAQTTVRNVVGRSLLDQVLTDTEKLNESIKHILDRITQQWGVFVLLVELKDIELPPTMQRAMARQAEAEREKRAKIIAAEGEALSAGRLAEAADVMADHPIALQLRNLQVLSEIAVEHNSTIVFPAQLLSSVRAVNRFVSKERPEHAEAPTLVP
ncbi:slipin family protein [Microtetraspora sp. NBRC 16547]|uniref:slipin family protein n=1 Tax=Microtetraspora sp. NBRC 16547 TaxID=3030993 RepID=UPI0024A40807|nr:slipin family protein [Microtetraspora sp. NBRC 16547]GLX02722.1 hypothetical protein Misp02_68080 [Microtetraspora sp. NBRC 16547]